jgi:hypothetical protein
MMNRYVPVPPIPTPRPSNSGKPDDADSEEDDDSADIGGDLEELSEGFSVNGEDMDEVIPELKKRLKSLSAMDDFSTEVGTPLPVFVL